MGERDQNGLRSGKRANEDFNKVLTILEGRQTEKAEARLCPKSLSVFGETVIS